jgi:hypothetical protein
MEPLMLAAAAVKSVGNLAQGVQGYQAGRYNARMARLEADARTREAADRASLQTEQTERAIGAGTAAAGASGFTLAGSAADVLGDLAGQGRFDARSLLYAGEIERRKLLAEAQMQKKAATWSLVSGTLKAAGSIMDGVGQAKSAGQQTKG